jgi:hypothetical protein
MRTIPLLIAGWLLATRLMAQVDNVPSDLEKWIAVDHPEPQSDAWFIANQDAEHEWVVTLREGRPSVGLRDPKAEAPDPLPLRIEPGSSRDGLAGRRFRVQVSDGWIVAFNAGEFGAGIWWFSPDGRKREKISEDQVVGLIPTEAGLLAPEGLAHGVSNRGQVVRLARDATGHWRSERFVDLKHAPEVAVKQADGSLIIATTNRLLRVLPKSRKVEVLADAPYWSGLYPNSIAITPSGTIYVGMRHGVAKVERNGDGSTLRWLLPNQAFVDMKPREGSK